jgi:hypothetical protein
MENEGRDAAGSNSLSGRFMLRPALGWGLLLVMGTCCAVLAFLPQQWRLLQTVAAMLQMFCSGVVAAALLPVWQPVPGATAPAAAREAAARRRPSLE